MADESKLVLKVDGRSAEKSTDSLNRKFRTLDQSGDKLERQFRDLSNGSRRFGSSLSRNSGTIANANSKFKALGASLLNIKTIFAGIAGISIGKVIKDSISTFAAFDHTMHGVSAILQTTDAQFSALSKKAQSLGQTTKFTAQESAAAIEMLARNGLAYTDIMGGALDSTLTLAAATGTDLSTAADIATDAMLQFNKSAGEMEEVVNQITGVTVNSKFTINDYAFAMAQAGGAAAELGVSFEDMNMVIAATSSLFKRGGDAGTSFKTFIQRMSSATNEAKQVMADYNIEFFDAQGNMRSMIDIAENLRTAFAGVSDEAKGAALTEIFGTDAIRTALGLMKLSNEELEKIQKNISGVDAAAQAAERSSSLGAMFTKLSSAVEGLANAIGERLAPYVRAVIEPLTEFINIITKKIEIPRLDLQIGEDIDAINDKIGKLFEMKKQVEDALAEDPDRNVVWNLDDINKRMDKLIGERSALYEKWKQARKEMGSGGSGGGLPTIEITEGMQQASTASQDWTKSLLDLGSALKEKAAKNAREAKKEFDALAKSTREAFEREAMTRADELEQKIAEVSKAVKLYGLDADTAAKLTKKYNLELVELASASGRGATEQEKLAAMLDKTGGAISDMQLNEANEGLAQMREEAAGAEESLFSLEKAMEDVQSNVQSGFSDMFYDIFQGKGIDSVKDFAKRVKDIFLRLIADIAAAWVASKIFKMPANFGFDLGGLFGGGNNGGGGGIWNAVKGIFSGGNGGNNGGGGTSVVQSVIQKGVVEGIKNSTMGKAVTTWFAKNVTGSYYAAGNLGFKGAGVMNYGTAATTTTGGTGAGASAGSAAGAGWGAAAGAAIVAAIAAYGFGTISKNRALKAQRREEWWNETGGRTNQFIGGDTAFRGTADGGAGFYSMDRANFVGLKNMIESIGKAQGSKTTVEGAGLDEFGNGLLKVRGDIEAINKALSASEITGVEFAKSLDYISEKGGNLRATFTGDTEAIKQALDATGQQYRVLGETGNTVTADLIGDHHAWAGEVQNIIDLQAKVASQFGGFAEAAAAAFESAGRDAQWFENAFKDGIVSSAELAQLGIKDLGDITSGVFKSIIGDAALAGKSIQEMAAALRAASSAASSISVARANPFGGRARGGSFQVGGSGGNDSQLVAFRASPDETVTVSTPGQQTRDFNGNSEILNELRMLRKQEGTRVVQAIREQELSSMAYSRR